MAPRTRDLMEFDRSDRIGAWVLIAALLAGTAYVTILDPVRRWVGGDAIEVGASLEQVGAPTLPAGGLSVESPTDVVLTVAAPTDGERLAQLVVGLGALACVALVGVLVLRLVGDLGRGDPFRRRNVTRLRVIALVVGFGPLLLAIVGSGVDAWLLASRMPEGASYTASWDVPVAWIVAMLLLAAIAQAFAIGARLRDDVEGLV